MSKIRSSMALACLVTGFASSALAQGAASLSGSVDRANAPSRARSSAEGWFSTEPGAPPTPPGLQTGGSGPATAVRPLPDTSGSGNPSPGIGSDTGAGTGTGIGAGIGSDTSGGVAGTTTGIGAGVGSDRAPTARNGTGTGVGSSPSSTGVGSTGGGAAGSR